MNRIGKGNSIVSGRKAPQTPVDTSRAEFMPPPPPDEAYWSALLNEGEITHGGSRHGETDWDDAETAYNPQRANNPDQEAHDWEVAEQVFADDKTVDLSVIGSNRGGLLVEWNNLRGFVPASQLVDFPTIADAQARRHQLVGRIGQPLTLRVIELDRAQNRLILSERAAQVGTRHTR